MSRLMSLAAPGTDRQGVGFDEPLEMLMECHRRVEAQCATLGRLIAHLGQHGSDAAAAEAAQAVLRYFELAAPKHHADEEEDLFPALLAAGTAQAARLQALTRSLQADHVELDRRWHALQPELTRIAMGQPAALDAAAVNGFRAAYADHIRREEAELLPMAAQVLDAPTQARIGQAMRRRRGAAA